jgi:hypothetical protein
VLTRSAVLLLEHGGRGQVAASSVRVGLSQHVPSDKLSSQEVRSSSFASMASIGNNRAKAISENDSNYEPDCESDCEVRQRIDGSTYVVKARDGAELKVALADNPQIAGVGRHGDAAG